MAEQPFLNNFILQTIQYLADRRLHARDAVNDLGGRGGAGG